MVVETISTQTLYDAFAIITQEGKRNEIGAYEYEGLIAESFNDGYNLTIKDMKVSVTLGFHNTQQHQFESTNDFGVFVKKLDRLTE